MTNNEYMDKLLNLKAMINYIQFEMSKIEDENSLSYFNKQEELEEIKSEILKLNKNYYKSYSKNNGGK